MYFSVVLFIMLYKVVLTFESVDEILQCDNSNESYWTVLCCRDISFLMKYFQNGIWSSVFNMNLTKFLTYNPFTASRIC